MPNKNVNQPSSLLQIPTDQIQLVLSYTTLSDLISLGLCSKNIQKMIQWTHYLTSHDPSSLQSNQITGGKENLRRSLPNVRNIDPISSHNFGRERSFYQARRTDMTVPKLAYCLNTFKYLRTVKLHQLHNMGDKFLPILNASAMKHTLTHLELHDVRIVKDGHVLDIPQDGRLSHVEVNGSIFCTYKVLKSFTTSRNLEVLRLIGCRALLDRDVKDIIQRQNSYAKGNRTGIGHDSSSRVIIHTSNCNDNRNGLSKQLSQQFTNTGSLRELQLNNCSKLVAPRIVCDTLQVLNLGRCNMLKDLSMIQCDNLIEADFSACCALENHDIEQFLQNHKRIEILSFGGSSGFTEIEIQSDCLQELNLGLCMGLEKCKIVASALNSLQLDMCVKLKDLRLELDVIKQLDLSMLTMKNFHIEASGLVNLNINGCCKLSSVEHFLCPKLMDLDICGTPLKPEMFKVSRKARIQAGGEVQDWSNPFRPRN